MRIAIIGTGYVGLVSGACLSEFGHEVVCIDKDAGKVEAIIRKKRPDAAFDMASNPEFLREGSALEDFRRPDRVVVGCDTERARGVMREVYRPLYLNETPILFTSRESSELIKYAAN